MVCKKSFILFGFCLLGCLSIDTQLYSQQLSGDVWHKGFLITAKKDTVVGGIRYDLDGNSMQVRQNKKVYSFSSHNILVGQIYDQITGDSRRFYSMPYEISNGFKTKVLFELLYEGPLSLLSREEVVQEALPNSSIYGRPVYRNKVKYNYYFLDNKGKITSYFGKKPELLQIMSRKSKLVKKFIKDNRLKSDQLRDLIRITAFYNSI